MTGLSVVVPQRLQTALRLMKSRAGTLGPPLRLLGQHMVTSSIPKNFAAGGRPKWAPSHRWGHPAADPLWDTGGLARSVGFTSTKFDLTLYAGGGSGKSSKKARLLQVGGTIVPVHAKVLVIPIVGSGALTITQARTMGPRDFPGAFSLWHGPEGPGIYIKKGIKVHGVHGKKKKGQGQMAITIVRIFAFVSKVVVPARPFLLFQPEDTRYGLGLLSRYCGGVENWKGGA